MTLWIDTQGTVIGNAALAQADCLQAVEDLSSTGLPVRLVSSSPGAVLCGRPIGDKADALRELQLGDVWVDDDTMVLKVVLRQGAITVPARCLCHLADLLCNGRRRAL